jgi:hypothetical protein
LAEFKSTVSGGDTPPADLSPALQALWHDARGDWHRAHECVQSENDGDGAWVHAYLHRKEGDLSNAGYWYRKAGKPAASGPLEAEWDALAEALLVSAG